MDPYNKDDSSFKRLVFRTAAQIEEFQIDLESQIPLLRKFSQNIIEENSRSRIEIELVLDSLLTLTIMGHKEIDFLDLLTYYQQLSPKGAEFYLREFSKATESNQTTS